MNEILASVRDELLLEARNSPHLLSDIARLECYVAETYSARSFIEMLQNADDAGARRFHMAQVDGWLVCSNDGRRFSRQDFYCLCRSGSSEKSRGQSIGYRGIGFKSVVGMAEEVHLYSGDLESTFSRALTRRVLGTELPIPLVRVPHPIDLEPTGALAGHLARLSGSGYSTTFVLGGIDKNKAAEEFALFEAEYLLFLRNLSEVRLISDRVDSLYTCRREPASKDCLTVNIGSRDSNSTWQIQSFNTCDIAFSMKNERRVPLVSSAAVVHAFLPTLEPTGFGVRINADFSTDPSRTRIILDEHSMRRIEDTANAIAKMFCLSLSAGTNEIDTALCVSPTIGLSAAPFLKKSLRTELLHRVREKLTDLNDQLFVAPTWLNLSDAVLVAGTAGKRIVPVDGLTGATLGEFLRYVGVAPLDFETALTAARHVHLSDKGCVELVVFAVRNAPTDPSGLDAASAPIWFGPNGRTDLLSLTMRGEPLSERFTEAFVNAGGSATDLELFSRSATSRGRSDSGVKLPQSENLCQGRSLAEDRIAQASGNDPLDPLAISADSNHTLAKPFRRPAEERFLPAWRGAEQAVAQILRSSKYNVEDHSRQNLGYDLAVSKDCRKYYIEVKLLDYPRQPFSITPNEHAVAVECGGGYVLALVLRTTDDLQIQFIHDPVGRLAFVRQCRQWVWECSKYDFDPMTF